MSTSRAVLAILVLLLAPLPGLSQSDQPQGDPESEGLEGNDAPDAGTGTSSGDGTPASNRKEYLVEVVTFRYLGADSSGGETFDQLFVEDHLPADPFDIGEYNRLKEAVSYTGMHALAGAVERLRLSERYQVTSAAAWVQPLLARNEAVDVPVSPDAGTDGSAPRTSSGDPLSSRLSGSVRVYGDYLLFVDVNLKIELPARPDDLEAADSGGDTGTTVITSTPVSGPERSGGFETFHLSERRRIKLEEYHYFDHPHIGAIVSVVRHEDG